MPRSEKDELPADRKRRCKRHQTMHELESEVIEYGEDEEITSLEEGKVLDYITKGAIKVRCRPRATEHGGATKTAVGR